MDFSPSEMERELRELARKILEEQATPDRLREIERAELNFDPDLWSALARANLLGVAVPAEHGGMGQGFAELAVLIEECGRAVAPVPAAGEAGIGLFLVDPAGAGVRRAKLISTAFEPQVLLALDGAAVPAQDVLVAPGPEGEAAARWTIERVQAALAAMQLGVCDRALSM